MGLAGTGLPPLVPKAPYLTLILAFPCPVFTAYGSQLAVVATFLHVPGVPPTVHTHSVASESM